MYNGPQFGAIIKGKPFLHPPMDGSKSGWFWNLLRRTPLYLKGDCHNYHPVWHRFCYCYGDEGIREVTTGFILIDERIRKQNAKEHDFICSVCSDVWGGELGWCRGEDGLKQLALSVRNLVRRSTGQPPVVVRSKSSDPQTEATGHD